MFTGTSLEFFFDISHPIGCAWILFYRLDLKSIIRPEMQLSWYPEPSGLSPNNTYRITITIKNNDKTTAYYISNMEIRLLGKNPVLRTIKVEKRLAKSNWLYDPSCTGSFEAVIKNNIVEPKQFTVRVCANQVIGASLGVNMTIDFPTQTFNIKPVPIYRAFISRSVRASEASIPDFISREIEKWGFQGYTVGIPPLNKQYSDNELVEEITSQIKQADIVFGIATKRDQLVNYINFKAPEWVQSETAIGYSMNKPVIMFVDKDVSLSGLASKFIFIQFDPCQMESITAYFDENIPRIRQIIQQQKDQSALTAVLAGVGIIGGIALVSLLSYHVGKESNQ
jgi:hypothetical protein